jgi:hypothetical protein
MKKEDEIIEEELEEDLSEEPEEGFSDEELEEDSDEDEEESEEDEYELEDILAEEKLKSSSSRLHQFLMSQNNQSSLNQRAVSPIMNLEEDLPEVKKRQSSQGEDIKIDYLKKPEEDSLSYKPSGSSTTPVYAQRRDFEKIYTSEEQFEQKQKQMYSSGSNVSSEVAFVQKQMKTNYVKPERLKDEDFGKEKKKTLDNPLFDMKQSYR